MKPTSTTTQAHKNTTNLVEKINAEMDAYAELGLLSGDANALIWPWQNLLISEPKRFIDEDGSVNLAALEDFRRSRIFVFDSPTFDVHKPSLRNLLGGERRGQIKWLRECLAILEEEGYGALLQKYPSPAVGNPFVYRHRGYSYTFRWAKHVYSLGLMNRVLGQRLDPEFVGLDIGSSYGIYPNLLKSEYPGSHQILADFPEQLILAYYFLGTCFPDARIAGIRELQSQETLTREFFLNFDFCLVPIPLYENIAGGAVDLVTNFASLQEMSRESFDTYLNAPAFQTAKYFFTQNRIQPFPDYDTDVTVRDYPVWESGKMLHFAISPVLSNGYRYERRNLFFNERVTRPPSFEYIGLI
jgi:putative sugar O-methyltransferase